MKNSKNDTNEDENGLRSDALKHVQIFNDEGLTIGIPTQIFWGGIAFSIILTFMLRWYIGPLFGFVYLYAMYEIHKNDPKAFKAWVEAARHARRDAWLNGVHKERKIKILDRK